MKNTIKNRTVVLLCLLGMLLPLSKAHAQSVCPPGSCIPPCMQFEVANNLPCDLNYVFGFVNGTTCGVNPGGTIPSGATVLLTAPCMYDQCDGGNCICATSWYIADQSVPTLIDYWGGIASANGSFLNIPFGDCVCPKGSIDVVWTTSGGLKKVTVSCSP